MQMTARRLFVLGDENQNQICQNQIESQSVVIMQDTKENQASTRRFNFASPKEMQCSVIVKMEQSKEVALQRSRKSNMRLIFCLIFFYSSLFRAIYLQRQQEELNEGKSINELPEPRDISQLLADKSMEDSFKDTVERSDAQNSEECKTILV